MSQNEENEECEDDDGGEFGYLFDESGTVEVNSTLPVNELKFTDESVIKRVYFLGRVIAKLFHEENIYYWTTGGTSLGKCRNDSNVHDFFYKQLRIFVSTQVAYSYLKNQ